MAGATLNAFQGDSGSGLMLSGADGRATIAGITSFGSLGCPSNELAVSKMRCGSDNNHSALLAVHARRRLFAKHLQLYRRLLLARFSIKNMV